jgi:hypothetical protein
MSWFGFLRVVRIFTFEAIATDGFVHEIEIEARTAKAARERAERLCVVRGWALIGRM